MAACEVYRRPAKDTALASTSSVKASSAYRLLNTTGSSLPLSSSGIQVLPGKSHGLDSDDLRRRVDIRYRQLRGLSGDHSFFEDFSPDSIKAQALSFVDRNRSAPLSRAQAQGVTHINIPAEVGLSIKGYSRCAAHQDLASSSAHVLGLFNFC